ncbi:winged helix-turn-helix transcriptional regulator [Parabacteroides goldsteinii]|uniref:winged helix-turn-helix domain-containing protein n=1 Tax=Parabacteroides goldsteinii TaxID=328812 RepID=UPI001CCA6EA5|nr:winged helix-turn-helix transcriptional regulator [Parabacteroides goldsteinii]UBD76874.1 winged helix-turn-helix transcriptional regulator [Parabacteroides goldsteinii]
MFPIINIDEINLSAPYFVYASFICRKDHPSLKIMLATFIDFQKKNSKTFEGGDSDKVIGWVGDRVGDKLSETQKRILNLMQQNPSVSAQSLSEEIGISKRKIEENIRTLRERSKIVRVGNAKSGHWEVLD